MASADEEAPIDVSSEMLDAVKIEASEFELDEAAPLDDANIEETLAQLQEEGVTAESVDADELFSSDFDELLQQVEEVTAETSSTAKEFQAEQQAPADEGDVDSSANIEVMAEDEIELPKVDLGEPFIEDVIELSEDDDEKNTKL